MLHDMGVLKLHDFDVSELHDMGVLKLHDLDVSK